MINAEDNIVVQLEKNGKTYTTTFHKKSYFTIMYGVLTHYLRLRPEHAIEKIENYELFQKELSYYFCGMLCHEYPYHFAMEIAYSTDQDNYWTIGYTEDLPDDWESWLEGFVKEHDLKWPCCDEMAL